MSVNLVRAYVRIFYDFSETVILYVAITCMGEHSIIEHIHISLTSLKDYIHINSQQTEAPQKDLRPTSAQEGSTRRSGFCWSIFVWMLFGKLS